MTKILSPRAWLPLGALVLGALAAGCGSEPAEETTEEAEAGDGKLHPPGSGVFVSADAACATLEAAQQNRLSKSGCTTTTLRPCPGLLQAITGQVCAEYDEGSVAGCVTYYDEKPSCADLGTAFKHCSPLTNASSCQ